jgi:hypothetical protein
MQDIKTPFVTEPRWIAHRQGPTLDSLAKGEIQDVRWSQKLPVDKLVEFGLKEGFLQEGFRQFPDPRKKVEVPIDIILLSQILQKLNNEHSLLLAPYMLNSAELITRLGYNVSHLDDGFNDRNQHKREAPFHGETLKHILMGCKAESLTDWFNQKWLHLWRKNSPGRTRQYIVDGTDLEVPEKHVRFYKGAGTRRNKDETLTHGYRVVWLAEIVDRKSVIVALRVGPAQTHDLVLAKELLKEFDFEPNSSVICDRGFIDGEWITKMKRDRGVDFFLPLRRNMDVTQSALSFAEHRQIWRSHPTREDQQVADIPLPHLFWSECPELQHGILVQWKRRDGDFDQVLFVTTKANVSGDQILENYDQRWEIEENHRQLKLFQGIEVFPSKKRSQVVFRMIMGVLAFNLMRLFLNSEECESWEDYTLKLIRQKRKQEKNPEVIIYTKDSFAILRQNQFLPLILELKRGPQKKLVATFRNLDKAAGFS